MTHKTFSTRPGKWAHKERWRKRLGTDGEDLTDILSDAPKRLRDLLRDREQFCGLMRQYPQHVLARKLGCSDRLISRLRTAYDIPDRPGEMPKPQFTGWSKGRVRTIVWRIMLGFGWCPRDCPVAYCGSDGALITEDCPLSFFYPPIDREEGEDESG